MRSAKFAISVPEEVMRQVDRAARTRGLTRSRFITNVLRVAARKLTDAEIVRAVDELCADPDIVAEQRETARAFQRAARRAGTKW